ncbi:MAG: type VI secretion system tube protein Hcp [Pseudomonadales bacterium]|jgi:type VI secretion system secreted protein Hcp|nr:type VI secretion system tube protein Hcp [Pseudomonadales bacterium]
MATDIFIKLDGIDGESTDDKHKEWIEVLSCSIGASQSGSGTVSSAGNLNTARADWSDFSFTHYLDLASPKLFEHCATGKTIRKVELHMNRAAGNKEVYQTFILSDVVVRSISQSGDQSADVPHESVALAFAKIEMTYKKYDTAGKNTGTMPFAYDLRTNQRA